MGMLWNTTLEAVKTALDIQLTARNNAQVRRAVASGTRAAEGLLRRRFRPWTGTRTIPVLATRAATQLYLGRYELITATSVVSDGTTITGYDLIPTPGLAEGDGGPPYYRLDLTTLSAWPADTVDITGVWGYRDDEETVGTLGATLGSATSATAAVTWSTADIGTGDVLRIDTERMVIRARTWVDSTQNIGAGLTASMAAVAVTVSNGGSFGVDEVIQVDAERMLITAITGTTLTVVRAWDGSVLAVHTIGADVYTLTGVELDRGQCGTTAAAHNSAAVIYRHVVPGLVADLSLAEGLNQLQQETAGYGSTSGSGESQITTGLGGLAALRAAARAAYRRPRTWLGV